MFIILKQVILCPDFVDLGDYLDGDPEDDSIEEIDNSRQEKRSENLEDYAIVEKRHQSRRFRTIR